HGCLQLVLILPDGTKSLIPAEWTDFEGAPAASGSPQLVGSLEDLLRLRSLVDAFLRRSVAAPVSTGADQESHASTEAELHQPTDCAALPVGAVRRGAKARRRGDPGAPPPASHGTPRSGADQ